MSLFLLPSVPVLPNKKKQKLQWPGSSGGFSMGRRNSGVSETSSEVDSAVDSPEISEAVTESPVSVTEKWLISLVLFILCW